MPKTELVKEEKLPFNRLRNTYKVSMPDVLTCRTIFENEDFELLNAKMLVERGDGEVFVRLECIEAAIMIGADHDIKQYSIKGKYKDHEVWINIAHGLVSIFAESLELIEGIGKGVI